MFVSDTELGGVTNTQGGQRDLERLENWTEGNLVKFDREICEALPLGRNNPGHQHMLWVTWLERSYA